MANKPKLHLSARQHQIFNILVTRGPTNKQIAQMLNITESTVKIHIGIILKRFGLQTRSQLIIHKDTYDIV